MITCTCGHRVQNTEDCFTVPIGETDKIGNKCIAYPTVCEECRDNYHKHNMILATKKERNRYIND